MEEGMEGERKRKSKEIQNVTLHIGCQIRLSGP